jgi:hypothetical protein
MRLPLIVASILCTLTWSAGSDAAPLKKAASSRKLGLSIRVQEGGWGNAGREQIEAVLYSVADELMSRLPRKLSAPIVVSHTDGHPLALYERGPQGEYLVHLHASDGRWHLYAYEFAHELCHIMSNFDENAGPGASRHNQWFEETLCETASLFTLKNLAATWADSPPAPGLAQHAEKLQRFAELLIREGHRQLPLDTSLAAWLMANEERLRKDPYQRQQNEVVANLLLPLFERDPQSWDALCYLNLEPADARNSLRQYLHNWYDNAPAEHRSFIAGVLDLLGLGDVTPRTAAATQGGVSDIPEGASQLAGMAAGEAGWIER